MKSPASAKAMTSGPRTARQEQHDREVDGVGDEDRRPPSWRLVTQPDSTGCGA